MRIGGAGAKPGIQFLLKPDGVVDRSLNDASQILTAPSTWAAHPELIEAVREPSLRDAAAQLSGNVAIYMNKSQVPTAVMKLVQDKDSAVRCVTAWYLHNGGRALELKDVLAIFQEILKAPDPWARRQAIQFLGKLGRQSRDAVPAITGLLDDKDEGVREAAATALKSIQGK